MPYGLDGGTVENVLIDPQNSDVLYAGTWGNGIFKSTDAGESWTAINEGLRSAYIYEVAIDPFDSQHLLASVYETGIDQSFDGGATWDATDGFPPYAVAYSIDFNPVDSSIVYAALREATIYDSSGNAVWWPGGVWKSTNGGGEWFDAGKNNGLIEDYIYDLAIDPQHPDTIYTANHKTGVYKTTNGGGHWDNVSSNLVHKDIRGIQVDPYNSNRIYAGIWDGYGFSYSTNGGESWVSVSSTNAQDMYVYEVQVDPKHPSSVYLTTSTGVYICENPSSGSTCPLVSDSGKFIFDVALDINGPAYSNGKTQNIYTGIQYNALHKSEDAGASFDPAYKGIRANIIQSMVIDPSNSDLQYVSSYGRGLFRTTDGGVNWTALHYTLGLKWINEIAFRPGVSDAVYVGDKYGGLYFTQDGGTSWVNGSTGISREALDRTEESGDQTDQAFGPYDWMDPVDYQDLMDAQPSAALDRATYPNVTAIGFDKDNNAYNVCRLRRQRH